MSRGGQVYYYETDALGSVNAVTNSSASVQNTYFYDAWGQVKSQTGSLANPFTYTSREVGEAGLNFYRARYYQPSVGRFLQEDPRGRTYRIPGQITPKLAFANSYAYVDNDPISWVDSSGYDRERPTPTPVPYPGPAPTPTPVPGAAKTCRVFPKAAVMGSTGFCRDISVNFFHGGQECYRQLGHGWHVCYQNDGSCNYHWDNVNPCRCRGSNGECSGCSLFDNPRGWNGHIGDDVIPGLL